MQNNGLIKFFTVLFGLVSLYQLSFTFVTSKVESDAKTHAQASVNTDDADYFTLVDIAERNYLDSIAEQKVFGVFNYASSYYHQCFWQVCQFIRAQLALTHHNTSVISNDSLTATQHDFGIEIGSG